MHLWNDYEGKTLAGAYLIEKLLSTEGRNACFATHDRSGRPAVLRLTEALNDQREMYARYGAIQSVGQPNLVTIQDFGEAEIEGIPLIYLVTEATDENLAEIVQERPLSIEETGAITLSLVAAVEALHARSLVHGYVQPASVFAVGRVVKLRSDCVRPAPEDENGARARAEDVFGIADVLHRCLTQQRLQGASDALALPEPYASIVRNVVRGSWGIEQVAHEARRAIRIPAPQPLVSELTKSGSAGISADSLFLEGALPGIPAASPGVEQVVAPTAVPNGSAPSRVQVYEARESNAGAVVKADPQLVFPYAGQGVSLAGRHSGEDDREPGPSARSSRLTGWIVGAATLCLLLILIWRFAGIRNKLNASAHNIAATTGTAAPSTLPTERTASSAPVAAAAAPVASEHRGLVPLRGEVWRVVAYTYNLEPQAQSKAHTIAERHAELHPQVFSRNGHSPFLVTLGGPLTEQQAMLMRERARNDGLARDVYMQNYSR